MSNNNQSVNVEVLSINKKLSYAGFWIRFLAYLIDGLLIGTIGGTLTAALNGSSASTFVSIALAAIYYVVMETSEYQGTLGKIAMGIKVVDLDGNKLSYPKAIIRYVSKFLSSLILLIGYIMAAFTEKKQGLHDIIAGTLVVKK